MPTGYTDPIYKGMENFTPQLFIARCARALGSMAHLRDHPMSSDLILTTEKVRDSYYADQVRAREEALSALRARSREEWQKERDVAEEEARKANAVAVERWTALSSRYDEHIAFVSSWVPPTEEHESLKKFALEQLEDSKRFDCGDSPYLAPLPPEDLDLYIQRAIEKAENDLGFSQRLLAEEQEREKKENHNAWIRALSESLNIPVVEP